MEAQNKALARSTFEATLEEAEEVLLAEIAEHPSYPDLRNRLGLLMFLKGDIRKAKGQFEMAMTANPDYASAISNLAHCYLRLGDFREASRWFQREIDIFPCMSRGYLDMWSFFYSSERFEDSERMAAKAAGLSHNDPFPSYLSLMSAARLGKAADLAGHTKRLKEMAGGNDIFPFLEDGYRLDEVDLNSNLHELFEYMSFLSAKNGRVEEAREWLTESQRNRPRLGGYMLALARIEESAGDAEKAFALRKEAARTSPSLPDCWIALGFEYCERARADDALAAFIRALELAPNYADIQFNCGLVYYEKENFEKAAERFKEALRINPGYTFARNSLAAALVKLGRVDNALDEYEKTIRAGLESPDVWISIAKLHIMKDSPSDAIVFLKMALEDDTRNLEALALLAGAYASLGKNDQAGEYRKRLEAATKGCSTETRLHTSGGKT